MVSYLDNTGETMTADLSTVPLIPRAALMGNPVRAQGKVSPDGR